MKKLLCILVSILLLCACTGKKDDITSNSAIKNSVELKTSTFSIDGYEFFDKNRLKTCLRYHYVQSHYKIF